MSGRDLGAELEARGRGLRRVGEESEASNWQGLRKPVGRDLRR